MTTYCLRLALCQFLWDLVLWVSPWEGGGRLRVKAGHTTLFVSVGAP